MSTTRFILVILAHPNLGTSRANAGLLDAIRGADGVQVRDLATLYPTNVIDVRAEQQALTEADDVVLQFPTYWYSTPGILKLWLDEVLTRGWAYGTGKPGVLAGKTLRIITTTGGAREAYAPGGFHGWNFDDILIPLQALARRVGMQWEEPLVIHGVRELTDQELARCGAEYRGLLEQEPQAEAA